MEPASRSARPSVDLRLLDELLRSDGIDALLDRCDELVADLPSDGGRRLLRDALRLCAPTLAQDPTQLPGQLLARLGGVDDPVVAELLTQAGNWDREAWLRPLTASLTAPGGPLVLCLCGHPDHLSAVAITPDGRRAVSGSVPRTVKLWDLERGTEVRTFKGWGRGGEGEGYGQDVDSLAITADATQVAASNGDGRVHLWETTGGALLTAVGGCDDEDWRSALSPDGRWAVSAFLASIIPIIEDEQAGTIELWDLQRGEAVRSLRCPGGRVTALAVTPGAGTLVAAAGKLHVWDLGGDAVRTIDHPTGTVYALAVTDDGHRAVTGHDDGTMKVWDLTSGSAPRTLSGHTGAVTAVAVTPDGRRAVSGSADATVRLWDLDQLTELAYLAGHVGGVRSVAVSSDGSRAVSGGTDRVLRVWNLDATTDPSAHRLPVQRVTISPDGRLAAATSADGTTEVWPLDGPLGGTTGAIADPAPGTTAGASGSGRDGIPQDLLDRLHTLECNSPPDGALIEVRAAAATPDLRRAVCATHRRTVLSGYHRWARDASTIRVWDLGAEPEGRLLTERAQNVVGFQQTEHHSDVAITPDGRYAVGVGEDRTVTLFDLDTATTVAAFTTDSPLRTCAISSDGRTVMAAGDTGQVQLLRLTTPA